MFVDESNNSNVETVRTIISALGLIIGPVIGALTAVGAIWIKEVFDRRKNSQAWFEQIYIADGIDCLAWYLEAFNIYFTKLLADADVPQVSNQTFTPHINLDSLDELPIDALIRAKMLFGTDVFNKVTVGLYDQLILTMNIESDKRSKVLITHKVELIRQACRALSELREKLMHLKIKNKAQVHDLKSDRGVMDIITALEGTVQQWLEGTEEREGLISQGL